MIVEEQFINGVYLFKSEPYRDHRGAFERVVCSETLETHGINSKFVQSSISYNNKKFTLRGMHFQNKPYEEEKLVKCIRGRIFDVVVDLRQGSSTEFKWLGVELSEFNQQMLFIPKGCAHGFLTLEDNSNVLYYMSEHYSPQHSAGINYLDPKISINWPCINKKEFIISQKDIELPYT